MLVMHRSKLLKVVIYSNYFIIFSFHVMLGIQFNFGRWYLSDGTGISAQPCGIPGSGGWEGVELKMVSAVKLGNFSVGVESLNI